VSELRLLPVAAGWSKQRRLVGAPVDDGDTGTPT
jgi:hypothetical protein